MARFRRIYEIAQGPLVIPAAAVVLVASWLPGDAPPQIARQGIRAEAAQGPVFIPAVTPPATVFPSQYGQQESNPPVSLAARRTESSSPVFVPSAPVAVPAVSGWVAGEGKPYYRVYVARAEYAAPVFPLPPAPNTVDKWVLADVRPALIPRAAVDPGAIGPGFVPSSVPAVSSWAADDSKPSRAVAVRREDSGTAVFVYPAVPLVSGYCAADPHVARKVVAGYYDQTVGPAISQPSPSSPVPVLSWLPPDVARSRRWYPTPQDGFLSPVFVATIPPFVVHDRARVVLSATASPKTVVGLSAGKASVQALTIKAPGVVLEYSTRETSAATVTIKAPKII